jgi:AraC-like DNA-binding protein
MALNNESNLNSIVQKGNFKLLTSFSNNSRVVLSKLHKANGVLKSFNGYGLFIPINENKVYELQNERFIVKPGQYLILNHNQNCTIKINSEIESTGLNIRINKDYIDQSLKTLDKQNDNFLDDLCENSGSNFRFIEGVYALSDNSLGKYIQKVLCNFDQKREELHMNDNELFFELAEEIVLSQGVIKEQVEKIFAKKFVTKKELFKRLYCARNMINDNLSHNFEMAALAKEVAISESLFFRSFKRAFGMTPHQYFISKKMETSAHSLQHSKNSIMDVAYNAGFEDLSSFSRSFKKCYGMSPSNFRKSCGK